MESASNILYLSGRVASAAEYSHESHGCRFFGFKLETKRLSGTLDVINMIISEPLLRDIDLSLGCYIETHCELRSFNKKTESGNRLIISAFIKEITLSPDEIFENSLSLTGAICKEPTYRKTPLGREICDVMLAINRKYGRSDYLPLIAWGRNARIAETFHTGDIISVLGRVQSREYIKVIDGEEIRKTAYEVSVSSIESAELNDC
ncbi:MAG: single-stranded DNA-binding protein [Oscillospiraceae bacterium]|nr:single-stranded DNA-binding protein [Oscillospiraceae bacterium]